MVDSLPLVTVGVGSYNNGKYIIETLESIRNQSYPNIYIIIVDDCSSDSSVEIIDNWLDGKNGINFLFIKNTRNLGISAVGNLIRTNAKGKYLSFIGSDDVLFLDKVKNQVEEFEKLDDDYSIVYGDTMKIDEEGMVLEESLFEAKFGENWECISGEIFEKVVEDFFFYTQSSLIRIESLKRIDFEFNGEFISEDWYMQLRLSQEFKIRGSRFIASKYRIIPTSMGSRFWNDEKKHVVIYSQFLMFNNLFSFEKRNSDRWSILVGKLKYLFIQMKNAKNASRFKVYKMGLVIFARTRQLSELKNIFDIRVHSRVKAIFKSAFFKK